jgi:hypothetical protein
VERNAVAVGGFLLATTLVSLAGCDIGAAPRNKAVRITATPISTRGGSTGAEPRLASREACCLRPLAAGEFRCRFRLPSVDAPYSCPPIGARAKGEALIMSNARRPYGGSIRDARRDRAPAR